MSAQTRPPLGPIDPIPDKLCLKKTWKHFYSYQEKWGNICDCDVAIMRSNTENIVGVTCAESIELPIIPHSQFHQARTLIIEHHESSYAPAYYAEFSSPQTIWTPKPDTLHRHHALTPRSVFIVVQLEHPRSWIMTAYRPHPLIYDVILDEAERRQHSLWHFRRETGLNVDELALAVVENMRSVHATPTKVNELWWLASAVGYGRLLQHVSGVSETLQEAEEILLKTNASVRQQLTSQLDWAKSMALLADAIKEQGPEELEAVLAQAEELLVVAEVVEADAAASAFCDEAGLLLAWLPVEWTHLGDAARRRLQMFAGTPSAVLTLWGAVEDATIGSLTRETAPGVRPASRLVDALIPQRSAWQRWKEQLAGLASQASAAVTAWIDQSMEGLTIAPQAPTMGGLEEAHAFAVSGHPSPDAPPYYRVFIVDADYPDGDEVTRAFMAHEGDLWLMGEDERALILIIAGDTPLLGSGLEQVLFALRDRSDVVVRTRELQPTQATKASR